MDNYTEVITNYLGKIGKLCSELEHEYDTDLFGFRGEPEIYDVPCRPNIFRIQQYYDRLLNPEDQFEKNLIEELFVNHLTLNEKDYLLTTIDAQHGGFPSRLLDISFNSLIGLFFAVAPHYTKKIDSSDSEDAMLYIFPIENMYTTASKEIQDSYTKIINKKDSNILEVEDKLNNFNFKFIDYTKSNPRIIAQKGGFILFPGNNFIEYPKYLRKELLIKAEDKKYLRDGLDKLFGINMATVYPEVTNHISMIVKRTNHIRNLSDKKNVEFNIRKSIESFYHRNNLFYNELIEIQNLIVEKKRESIDKEIRKLSFKENYIKFLLDVETFIYELKINFENKSVYNTEKSKVVDKNYLTQDSKNIEKEKYNTELIDEYLQEIFGLLNEFMIDFNNSIKKINIQYNKTFGVKDINNSNFTMIVDQIGKN